MMDNRVTWQEVEQAAKDAVRHHMNKDFVQDFCFYWEENLSFILTMILDGSYVEHIAYRQLVKTNRNGKVRNVDSPTLVTRILQYVFINRAQPLYDALDNHVAFNCKTGCGLNASDKRLSVRHHVKSMFYDRCDIHYVTLVDQRKCYEHIRTRVFRKALKAMGIHGWLLDYACHVTMVDGHLPIGTPVSPLAHHIVMLSFDKAMNESYPFYLRYADNIMVGTNTKQEAQTALWRVKQWWWYGMGVRANRWDSRVTPIDGVAVDFCGTVYHRNPDKSFFDHNKGYATIRKSTAKAAKKAKPNNWGCYFGQLMGADTFNLINSIQHKNMKLADLVAKVRIDRKMDAPQVQPKELQGITLNVLDYEIRKNTRGVDNWIKLLISYDETDVNGMPTGREIVREIHGDYAGLHRYIRSAERALGGKQAILPIEDAEIINSCGYIFKGSTNMMEYIEDFHNQTTLQQSF